MTIKAYKDHPIRESLNRLKSLQKSPEFSSPEISADENASYDRDKIFGIGRALSALIEQTPATLVSYRALNQIQSHIQAPLNELTSFISNKNPGHLQNAVSQMEQNIMPLFWAFGSKAIFSSKGESVSFIDDLQNTAEASISTLIEQRNVLSAELDSLKSVIAEQETRLETLTQNASKERAEASAAVSKLEQQYSEKEIERNVAFESLLKQSDTKLIAASKAAQSGADELLIKLSGLRDDAARIVGVVGDIGVTGNYQKIAKTESEQANFWRWATVIIFGCGIAIAVATFIKYYHEAIDSSNVWAIAIRLLYAIAITAPAFYTARESARHRTNSDRAKQTELELAALGPFIELMPDAKKTEIREKLSQVYFGKEIEPHTVKDAVDANFVKDLAIELAKVLKR